ncbi:MAG: hypothetical protein OEZ06_06875 [Myxococcales bacterium]|nr:hypothetical protein [Myxococcales bacterium]
MTVQTYRAPKYEQALERIKSELGPGAVILSTRAVSPRGVEVRALSEIDAQEKGLLLADGSFRGSLARKLESQGVPHATAAALEDRVCERDGAVPRHPRMLAESVARALGEELHFAAGDPGCLQLPRITALVGPTGVGKTTTLAKLAAVAALVDGERVGLVSLDQYRIGGAEQLQHYADLIGIPMVPADDAASLSRALDRLADADRILIDTAGRAPKDFHAFGQLAHFLHDGGRSIGVQLCVATATPARELEAVVERHLRLGVTGVIATKLDEAVTFGSIARAQISANAPLTYFTTGQRVPEDLTAASADHLAMLLCQREEMQ